jgi:hypothetical protein
MHVCARAGARPHHPATTTPQTGGGPWDGAWSAKARMREPLKSLVKLPIDVGALARAGPQALRPAGL